MNKNSYEMKVKIENILLRFKLSQKTLDESTKEMLILFDVSKSFSCANENLMENKCEKQCMSCAVEDIRKIVQ